MFFWKYKKRAAELEARQSHLEAENAHLKQWVDYFQARPAIETAQALEQSRAELYAQQAQLATIRAEQKTALQQIIETDEIALLQEVGIYQYHHPLENAVSYQARLQEIKESIKALAKNGAVDANQKWMVDGSAQKGAKMVKDFSKLMLRTYNVEADNLVKNLRPYTLDSAIARLEKSRDAVAKLGATMSLQITASYHRLRLKELSLTADYLAKLAEEKEQMREERARQREEEKAIRELEAERRRLEKEQTHYATALAKLRANGDADGAAKLETKLAEIAGGLAGLEAREANIRAGYVYVISNFGSFGERIVKIGMTRRLDPMDRIHELGDASVPFRFDVHALIFSHDAVGLETKLHTTFKDRRVNLVNHRREYFYVTPQEVRDVLARFGTEYLLEFELIPIADEWRQSGGAQRTQRLAAATSPQ